MSIPALFALTQTGENILMANNGGDWWNKIKDNELLINH